MWNEQTNNFWNDIQQDTRSNYEVISNTYVLRKIFHIIWDLILYYAFEQMLSDALTKAMEKQDVFEVIQLFRQGAPPHVNAVRSNSYFCFVFSFLSLVGYDLFSFLKQVRLFDNLILLKCLTYAGMNPNEVLLTLKSHFTSIQ